MNTNSDKTKTVSPGYSGITLLWVGLLAAATGTWLGAGL